MIHRLPISETLRPYVKSILILMLKLMEIENEENVLVCLKIFMELHKQYRPPYSTEVDVSIVISIVELKLYFSFYLLLVLTISWPCTIVMAKMSLSKVPCCDYS